MDSSSKEGLVGVDVANPADQPRLHEKRFDRLPALPSQADQVSGSEVRAERFNALALAELLLQPCLLLTRPNHDATEAAGIVKAQLHATVQLQAEMIMGCPRSSWRKKTEPAGHAEMNNYHAGIIHVDEQIFSPPIKSSDGAAADVFIKQLHRHWQAQSFA